jgi:hypothetical protein
MRSTTIILVLAVLFTWFWKASFYGSGANAPEPPRGQPNHSLSLVDSDPLNLGPGNSTRHPDGAKTDTPFPVQLIALSRNQRPIPLGMGLEAWKTYYDWFTTEEGNMVSQKDGVQREWWMVDQEILALAREALPEKLQESQEFFDSHRKTEEAMGEKDPGLLILKQNMDRYAEDLGSMSWNLDWLLAQDPHSDVARHLSNYLVSQARFGSLSAEYYNQTSPFQKLNFPIESHVKRITNIDFYNLSSKAQTRLRDSYSLLLLEGSEQKSKLQISMGAVSRSTIDLGLPYPAGIAQGALVSPILETGKLQMGARWAEFMDEIRSEIQ